MLRVQESELAGLKGKSGRGLEVVCVCSRVHINKLVIQEDKDYN